MPGSGQRDRTTEVAHYHHHSRKAADVTALGYSRPSRVGNRSRG